MSSKILVNKWHIAAASCDHDLQKHDPEMKILKHPMQDCWSGDVELAVADLVRIPGSRQMFKRESNYWNFHYVSAGTQTVSDLYHEGFLRNPGCQIERIFFAF